jgi:hypothetical protein
VPRTKTRGRCWRPFSLEKLRIIQRFSEDLDVLVVGDYDSKRSAKTMLKTMPATAASATGGECYDERSGGNVGTFHRSAYLGLSLEHQPSSPTPREMTDAELRQCAAEIVDEF